MMADKHHKEAHTGKNSNKKSRKEEGLPNLSPEEKENTDLSCLNDEADMEAEIPYV